MKREILISATQREIRVAILEDEQLVELQFNELFVLEDGDTDLALCRADQDLALHGYLELMSPRPGTGSTMERPLDRAPRPRPRGRPRRSRAVGAACDPSSGVSGPEEAEARGPGRPSPSTFAEGRHRRAYMGSARLSD